MGKRKPSSPTPGTPSGTPGTPSGGSPTQPVRWGSVDLSAIASRMGLAPDADVNTVVSKLAMQGVSPQDIAAFALDGQKALDFIDAQTQTVNNLNPNTAATPVDLDDADPATARLTPEEVEEYFRAAVTGAGSGAARDVRLRGGGVSVQGTFRRPPPEAAGDDPPATGKGKRQKKPADPKPGDPGYFEFQDAQADRKWREKGRNPPIGTSALRWVKRNPEAAAVLGGGVGAAAYGIGQGVRAMMGGGEQQQPQGRFIRESDQQLLQDMEQELQLPADAAPGGGATMQAPPTDAASLLMRIRQSRSM